MPKILFDNEKFTTDAHGGIVRYFAELMRHFDTMAGVSYDMPIVQSNNEYLESLPRFAGQLKPLPSFQDFLKGYQFRGKGRLYRLWCKLYAARANRVQMQKALKKADFDLYHPTYYDPHFLDQIGSKPFVLTVYDMIHELLLNQYAQIDPTIAHKRKLVAKATRIIAISESTKNDLMKICDVPADKIDVVYLGNSLEPVESSIRPDDVPARYILFVGTRIRYKNFNLFAKAVAPLLREQPDLHLLCIGWTGFDAAEQALLEAEGIAGKTLRRTANDQELAVYYSHAEAFVFPSLYEGFGIPVLEAFACGCPAIISNVSSLPEVGGDAAAYFDPNDAHSIYQAVKDVVNNPARQDDMRAKGYARLKEFSWDKTAAETLKVYERAMADHAALQQPVQKVAS